MEMAKYGAGVSATVAVVNPLVGGAGRIISGVTHVTAGLIERQNRQDIQTV